MDKMIILVRTLHGIITAFFLVCLGFVFYAGITGRQMTLGWIAMGCILVEGIILLFNKGDCPLGSVHHAVGDDKTFFELLMPKPLAKRAVPILSIVAFIGFLLLIF